MALGSQLGNLCVAVLHREKLELSVRVLARVVCGILGGDRALLTKTPDMRSMEVAVQCCLIVVTCLLLRTLRCPSSCWLATRSHDGSAHTFKSSF